MNNYISPIQKIEFPPVTEMEDDLICKVSQMIGYEIDRHELVKALMYDRDQYNKGYADGKADAQWKLFEVTRPATTGFYLTYYNHRVNISQWFISGNWYNAYGSNITDKVIYWREFPDPPTAINKE